MITTVVGSYPQPEWLIRRDDLRSRPPPRAGAPELWRMEGDLLRQAQDDATLLAIRELESVGIDIITDGEIRRESYSNVFASALEGMDIKNPATSYGRTGRPVLVPRVTGPIRWPGPVLKREAEFLKRNTHRMTKITLPGPFTVSQQAQNDYYSDESDFVRDVAIAVNQEAKALKATGVDVVQLDEPYLQHSPEKAKEYAVEAINTALQGLPGPTALHSCFGYGFIVKDKPNRYAFLTELDRCTADQISIEAAQPRLDLSALKEMHKTILLGVLDLGTDRVETPGEVAERIRKGLEVLPPERLQVAPDCGMKYLDRAVAFGKLRALVDGAMLVKSELG